MSLKGIFSYRRRRNPGNVIHILTKDQLPPINTNLVVYSTLQSVQYHRNNGMLS